MTIPVRRTFESLDPRWSVQVTDDGSCTLIDQHCGDAMHSGCGAVAETEWVYLRNSGVATRLEAGQPTRVLEIGLGTGLGCMLSANKAALHHTPLDYVALENKLAPSAVIRQLQFDRQGLPLWCINSFCELLRQAELTAGSRHEGQVGDFCQVTIELGDAQHWSGDGHPPFDAIYFDPFSPETSPDLWTAAVLSRMLAGLRPGGRLTSYCVSRRVRDTMREVGFQVERVPGPPGGKREVLIAIRV